MLFHVIYKVSQGISFIKGLVRNQGLSEMLAYGVYVGEILAPLLLILGWKSKLWAGVMVINMLMAIYLAHSGDIFKLGAHGSWAIEVPMFYLLSALAVVLLGSGKYAVVRD